MTRGLRRSPSRRIPAAVLCAFGLASAGCAMERDLATVEPTIGARPASYVVPPQPLVATNPAAAVPAVPAPPPGAAPAPPPVAAPVTAAPVAAGGYPAGTIVAPSTLSQPASAPYWFQNATPAPRQPVVAQAPAHSWPASFLAVSKAPPNSNSAVAN